LGGGTHIHGKAAGRYSISPANKVERGIAIYVIAVSHRLTFDSLEMYAELYLFGHSSGGCAVLAAALKLGQAVKGFYIYEPINVDSKTIRHVHLPIFLHKFRMAWGMGHVHPLKFSAQIRVAWGMELVFVEGGGGGVHSPFNFRASLDAVAALIDNVILSLWYHCKCL
jgi:pimeloyl-ACP methyl ester carboxylesterase